MEALSKFHLQKYIFPELGFSGKYYYDALPVLRDSDFQSHIKHEPNARFVNNCYIGWLQI